MVDIPHISVYEIFPDQPSKKVGTLMAPDQLNALAIAMSHVEEAFLNNKAKIGIKLAMIYKNYCQKMPAMGYRVFADYCKACADMGTLMEKPEWTINPEEISKGVRAWLFSLLLSEFVITNEEAGGLGATFMIFDLLIKKELQRLDEPTPFLKRIFPGWTKTHFNKEIGTKAHDVLTRLIKLCKLSQEENRSFSFDRPDNQAEKSLDLGDIRIRSQKGGGLTID